MAGLTGEQLDGCRDGLTLLPIVGFWVGILEGRVLTDRGDGPVRTAI